MKPLSSYLLLFLGLLAFGALVIGVLWFLDTPSNWIEFSAINLVFFFVVTMVSFSIFYFSFSGKNSAFLAVVVSFLGKLILSAILVLIIKQFRSIEMLPFFVPFAFSYMLFTIPEVVVLVRIGVKLAESEKYENKE